MITAVAALLHFKLPGGAFGGALIALGLMARGTPFTNANGAYLKLKQQGLADDAIRTQLANKAKRSPGLAVAGLAGAFVVQGIVVALTHD